MDHEQRITNLENKVAKLEGFLKQVEGMVEAAFLSAFKETLDEIELPENFPKKFVQDCLKDL